MTDYGYRSITVPAPSGVAGSILRGNLKRHQRKGQAFATTLPSTVLLNRVNGEIRSVTVLNRAGEAVARLDPTAKF